MENKLKITTIINSYNYEGYIEETLQSVFNQTVVPDEIIVVDDGSTDASCSVIQKYVDKYPDLKFIKKTNGGQLSAFNAAAQHVTGDLIFFIDSDDIWCSGYIEKIVEIYKTKHTDFVFCSFKEFGSSNEIVKKYDFDVDFCFSVALTAFRKKYIGGPTSTLSIRKNAFDRIFPVMMEEDWRTCADLPLVFGASLAGARKYYCALPLVLYRLHEKNAHKDHFNNQDYSYRLGYNREKLTNYFLNKFNLQENTCANLVKREISMKELFLDKEMFVGYMRIVYEQNKPAYWKIQNYLKIIKKYIKIRGTANAQRKK